MFYGVRKQKPTFDWLKQTISTWTHSYNQQVLDLAWKARKDSNILISSHRSCLNFSQSGKCEVIKMIPLQFHLVNNVKTKWTLRVNSYIHLTVHPAIHPTIHPSAVVCGAGINPNWQDSTWDHLEDHLFLVQIIIFHRLHWNMLY